MITPIGPSSPINLPIPYRAGITEADIDYWMSRPSDAIDELDRIDCEESLLAFTKRMWSVLEPGRELVDGWPLEAICEHLEAITYGQIQKLLINVPPGFMKSLLTDVFWPAWEWGPRRMPWLRYVAFSYSSSLTQRDNRRFRDVMMSQDYARLFGHFSLTKIGEELVHNDQTGWKLATSIGGVGTGERGDRVILDDPHNVKESESDAVRQETIRWFRESMASRLNDASKSAVVIIMQRVHEEDVSGVVLSELQNDYHHLCIPMEWEGQDRISTVPEMTWNLDPRTRDGELAWPRRFDAKASRNLKTTVGPYAWAGQFQQSPTPRGGGIFRRDWWQLWDPPPDKNGNTRFPACEFVVASLDGAFGQKQENDWTALTIWGVFRYGTGVVPSSIRTQRHYLEQVMDPTGQPTAARSAARFPQAPKLMLMHGWRKRLPLNGPDAVQLQGETDDEFKQRRMREWGIVQWAANTCRRFGVNILLVEAKANGIDVYNEIKRQYAGESWGVQLVNPGRLDKVARAYSVQHIFSDAMVYYPDREWADEVITEMANFPKVAHDDYTDSSTQAIKWLRDRGLLMHGHEMERELAEQLQYKSQAASKPLYPT